jgi:hypothetical protein
MLPESNMSIRACCASEAVRESSNSVASVRFSPMEIFERLVEFSSPPREASFQLFLEPQQMLLER